MQHAQLTLPVQLPQAATFDNFFPEHNQVLLAQLKTILTVPSQIILLWGDNGCGLSHLCQACCHAASEQDLTTAYIPLKNHAEFSPDVLEDLAVLQVVCVDDVDAIAGSAEWELALFNLYIAAKQSGCCLVMTSHTAPAAMAISLADLKSRLGGSLVYRVQPLSDEAKHQVLRQRAAQHGMQLPAEVAEYLLHHYSRDMHALTQLLTTLDTASLSAQRRLTIPFVKQIIA